MTDINNSIHNDEPTIEDKLDREQYARAFANIVASCNTPMVIGLYGTWGVGKTSLMKLIENKLDTNRIHTVWFNPWEHQFDNNPMLAFTHKLVDSVKKKVQSEAKETLTMICSALGTSILKRVSGLSLEDMQALLDMYNENEFNNRETRVKLKDKFEELINKILSLYEKERLVVFIDDLDRCLPEFSLKMLEALKLYLTLDGCVYFLGVDKHSLENSIKHRYEKLEVSHVDYLDKIVQLPFTIPLIEQGCMKNYVEPLLTEDLKPCADMLAECLVDNPRQVKRFINIFILNHELAKDNINDYDPKTLAILLLIQLITPDLYKRLSRVDDLLNSLHHIKELEDEDKQKKILNTYLDQHENLYSIIMSSNLPDVKMLKRYIFLTTTASVADAVTDKISGIKQPSVENILANHIKWIQSKGHSGKRANLRKADLREAFLNRAFLRRADLCGADLREADLRETDFREADMPEANLSGVHLDNITYNFSTKWPEDFTPPHASKTSEQNL